MTRAIATHVCLENASATMQEAGEFAWAVGRLLQCLAESGDNDKVLSNAVLTGLGHGLKFVGVSLQQDAEQYRHLIQSAAKSATQNAETQNVSANTAVPV